MIVDDWADIAAEIASAARWAGGGNSVGDEGDDSPSPADDKAPAQESTKEG